MTELDEYSSHDCIARSTKITTATRSSGDHAGRPCGQPLVETAVGVSDDDADDDGDDAEAEQQPHVHAVAVEDQLQREPRHDADRGGGQRAVERLAVPEPGHHGGDAVGDARRRAAPMTIGPRPGIEQPSGRRDVDEDRGRRRRRRPRRRSAVGRADRRRRCSRARPPTSAPSTMSHGGNSAPSRSQSLKSMPPIALRITATQKTGSEKKTNVKNVVV